MSNPAFDLSAPNVAAVLIAIDSTVLAGAIADAHAADFASGLELERFVNDADATVVAAVTVLHWHATEVDLHDGPFFYLTTCVESACSWVVVYRNPDEDDCRSIVRCGDTFPLSWAAITDSKGNHMLAFAGAKPLPTGPRQ